MEGIGCGWEQTEATVKPFQVFVTLGINLCLKILEAVEDNPRLSCQQIARCWLKAVALVRCQIERAASVVSNCLGVLFSQQDFGICSESNHDGTFPILASE